MINLISHKTAEILTYFNNIKLIICKFLDKSDIMGDEINNIKTIGIWMSEKKSQKLNWKELISACASHGYNVVKLDLDRPLEDQGHIDIFLHKLTDIIAAADQGDSKASTIIGRVEQFLSNHPNVTVIDQLNNVRVLLNRHCYYSILQEEPSFRKQGIFTPNFAEFTTNNIELNIEIMRQRGVKFPVVCKPTLAHGSKSAHEMIIIFNEKGLNVCKPPCVVQSFVNHNAVLHKVFLVGDRWVIPCNLFVIFGEGKKMQTKGYCNKIGKHITWSGISLRHVVFS
ncbi:hypothetical protein O3G_MSEX001546 [Manduca sexta]|uniref:Inositol-tetrakisphosphate 1-kinase n=1 Tax=Manduca sexta TaxID=7130 RepID=A0A922CCC5_MANSE|nr:hypothetical protein O3G_MSEX001546 [Manduca sexta]